MKIQFKQNGGGLPPLNDYVPVTYSGGSSDRTIQTEDSNDTSMKDIFDLIKGLDGLPSDVNYFTEQVRRFFSSPLQSQNPSALSSMYLTMISRANQFKFSKEQFGNTKTEIINKGGLNEIAINPQGYVYAKNQEGEIVIVSPEEFYNKKDSLVPVTNDDLLNMRAYDNPMRDEILTTVNNGTGMKDITSRINTMINTLGTTELKESNLTQGEKNGFVLLTQLATAAGIKGTDIDALFKSELVSKDQQAQILHALNYVYNNLTNSEKALLISKTGSEEEAINYIGDLYYSKQSITKSITNEPFTGKIGGEGSGNSSGDIKSNPLARIQMGEGGSPGKFTIRTKEDDKAFTVDAVNYGKVPGIDDDCNLDEFLTKSGIDQLMAFRGRNITFGDQDVDSTDFQDIMYDNQGLTVVSLPAIIGEDGVQKVNFGVIDEYRAACDDFEKRTGLKNFNLIKTKEQLDIWLDVLKLHDLYQYAYTDENGHFDQSKFGTFIVVDAYMIDKNRKLNKDSNFIESVTDRQELKRLHDKIAKGLSINSESEQNNKNRYSYKYDPKDKPGLFEFGNDKTYKGTLFIPIHNNLNAAYYDTYQMDMSQVSQVEAAKQQYDKRVNQNSNSSNLL